MEAHIYAKVSYDGDEDVAVLVDKLPVKVYKIVRRGKEPYDLVIIRGKLVKNDHLDEQIEEFLVDLMSLTPNLKEAMPGCGLELALAVYTEGQANPGIHLSRRTMTLLSRYNAEVDLDLYVT